MGGRAMKKKNQNRPSITTSITGLFAILFLLISLPTALLALQFADSGLKQARQTNLWLLESYMNQIDRELDVAEHYTNTLTFQNNETAYLTSRNASSFFYTSNKISTDIRKNLLNYQYISGFFLYVASSDFFYTYMNDPQSLDMEENIRDFIRNSYLHNMEHSSDWTYVTILDTPYLIQGYENNGIYGGAFLNVHALPQLEGVGKRMVHFVVSDKIEALSDSIGYWDEFMHASSSLSPLSIYEIVSKKETMATIPFLQRYAILFLLEVCILLMLCYLNLKKWIASPLVELKAAMEQLDGGNLDYQLPETASAEEFFQIEQTFNRMTSDIKNLKIEVYEEQLQTQKTKLHNLTYQLRPHFLVNSLNMVYNMIVSGDQKNALKLIRFSIQYLRYLLGNQDDFAPLLAELEHLENYLKIQMLRYENLLEYEIHIDPFVRDIDIPSMLLQNFAENSIKYSICPDRLTKITISIDYQDIQGISYARILIRDNGTGYPDWLIKALENQDPDALQDRIGLYNNLMRIHMLFQDRASCRFYNQEGAVVEFLFPL